MLNEKAKKVYEFMKNHYIKEGYIANGCLTRYRILAVLEFRDYKHISKILKELEDAQLIQRRSCKFFAVELVKEEKKKLIVKYNLGTTWKEKACSFYNEIISKEISEAITT